MASANSPWGSGSYKWGWLGYVNDTVGLIWNHVLTSPEALQAALGDVQAEIAKQNAIIASATQNLQLARALWTLAKLDDVPVPLMSDEDGVIIVWSSPRGIDNVMMANNAGEFYLKDDRPRGIPALIDLTLNLFPLFSAEIKAARAAAVAEDILASSAARTALLAEKNRPLSGWCLRSCNNLALSPARRSSRPKVKRQLRTSSRAMKSSPDRRIRQTHPSAPAPSKNCSSFPRRPWNFAPVAGRSKPRQNTRSSWRAGLGSIRRVAARRYACRA